MATLTLGVKINFQKTGSGDKDGTVGLQKLREKFREATKDGDALATTVGKIGAAVGLTALAWKGFDAIKDMVTAGFAFNSQMEQSKLGLAAIIGQFGVIRDSSGNVLTGFNNQLRVAGQLQEKLKILALQTTAEYSDLVVALQSSLGPGLRAFGKESGDTLDKVLKFTQDAALAWGAMGRDMKMLPQEMRALLKGEAGPDNELVNLLFSDKIGKGGGLQKFIKELQDAGKYSEELGRRMESFTKVGQYAGNTLAGAWSNLKDAFTQALGAGTQGQFSAVTQLVKELTSKIVTFDEKGKATFNPEFVKSINDITTAFVDLAKALGGVADKLPGILNYAAQLAKPDIWTWVFAAAGAAAGGALGGPKGAVVGATAMYAYGGWQQKELLDSTKVEGTNTSDVAIMERRLSNINKYLMYLKRMGESGDDGVKAWVAGEMDATKNIDLPRRGGLGGERWDTRFWEKQTTVDGNLTVSGKGTGGSVVDDKAAAKAKRLQDVIDDLTASAKVFGEEQRKLVNQAGFEAVADREEAAIKRLDAARETSAAQFATMIARATDPIQKSELQRMAALDAIDRDADKFRAEQAKQLAQFRGALQTLDDEASAFRAKQDKELQDLMQKGLTFGTPQYRQALAAQESEYLAFAERQFVDRENLSAKITGLGVEETDAVKRQQAERERINAETDAAIVENWSGTLEDINDRTVESYRDAILQVRQQFESFYRGVGSGLKNALATSMQGGGFRAAFTDFFQTVFDGIGETFGKMIDDWTTKLSLMATGRDFVIGPDGRPREKLDAAGNPVLKDWGAKGTAAKYGMAGLQGASALYGLYTNPAPKQAQNVLSGAMSGVSIGATVGGIYGAIIGGVIGALAGAFAPTEKGKNVRITGKGGGAGNGFSITGMDSDWGAAKLRQSINQAVRSTAATLDAIFLALPTSALEAMANWRPDLKKLDVTGKADGKNWNEELDNFLKETLPKRVFDAYNGSITAALKFAGVTNQRISELTSFLGTLNTNEAIAALGNYMKVVYGFKDLMDVLFGGQPGSGGRTRAAGKGGNVVDAGERFTRGVYERADRGPLAAFEDMSARIAVLSNGFDDLTHEEQVARGQQILDLSRDFFGGMEEYLLRLRDSKNALNDSLDAQLREIDLDQLSQKADGGKSQIEYLLAEQRKYRDELKNATSQSEVDRIVAAMQQNAGSLYTLLGRTPEAADQIRKQIEDMRNLANERYAVFEKNAEKMVTDAYDLIKSILLKLQGGLDGILTGGGGGGGGLPGDNDPNGPRHRDDALAEVVAFGAAASLGSRGLTNEFAPALSDATAKLLQFSSGLASATIAPPTPNINVQLGDTQVHVHLEGSAEELISRVAAVVVPMATAAATERIFSTIGRQSQRFAMTGRRG